MTTRTATALLTERDIASLEATIDRLTKLANENNVTAWLPMLADDVVFLPPNEPAIVGKEAVGHFLETFPPFKRHTAKCLQFEGHKDLAWIRGSYDMTIEVEGKPVRSVGKWTGTARMEPNGTWLMLSDMWSADQAE